MVIFNSYVSLPEGNLDPKMDPKMDPVYSAVVVPTSRWTSSDRQRSQGAKATHLVLSCLNGQLCSVAQPGLCNLCNACETQGATDATDATGLEIAAGENLTLPRTSYTISIGIFQAKHGQTLVVWISCCDLTWSRDRHTCAMQTETGLLVILFLPPTFVHP